MRQMFKALIAAVAVMATAPAMACGFNPCGAPVYAAPVVNYGYTGCNAGCGGYGYGAVERLPDPEQYYAAPVQQQYYYVNQGPTYTGPGDWAPRPVYREGYGRPYYGHRHYGYGYRHSGYGYRHDGYRPHRAWYPRTSYYHHPRVGYGYGPRQAYAPRYAPAPYRYGHHALRRYY